MRSETLLPQEMSSSSNSGSTSLGHSRLWLCMVLIIQVQEKLRHFAEPSLATGDSDADEEEDERGLTGRLPQDCVSGFRPESSLPMRLGFLFPAVCKMLRRREGTASINSGGTCNRTPT